MHCSLAYLYFCSLSDKVSSLANFSKFGMLAQGNVRHRGNNHASPSPCLSQQAGYRSLCKMDVWYKAYPALSFSFISVMPSLDTSLLKTRIPITMLTCQREEAQD